VIILLTGVYAGSTETVRLYDPGATHIMYVPSVVVETVAGSPESPSATTCTQGSGRRSPYMSYQYTVPRIIDIDACDGVTIRENAARPRTKRRTAVTRFIARALFHLRIIGYASLSIRKLTDTYNPIRAETAQAVSAFPLRWRQGHVATSANVKLRRSARSRILRL
jgi:hypothetical protein